MASDVSSSSESEGDESSEGAAGAASAAKNSNAAASVDRSNATPNRSQKLDSGAPESSGGGSAAADEDEQHASQSNSEADSADGEDGAIVIGTGPDDVQLDPEEWGIGAAAGNPHADATLTEMEDATPRIAIVDQDWGRTRAVDLFAVLHSCLGGRGVLRRLTVYESDYGRQEMAREAAHGPRGVAVRAFLHNLSAPCCRPCCRY